MTRPRAFARGRAGAASVTLAALVPAASSPSLLAAAALASALACAPGQAGADPSTPAAPAPELAPDPPPRETEPTEPAPEPAPVAFDPATAASLRARIVAIPNRKHWVPCGGRHSVGALEVEVQDAGEPPPRMILFVSCPADLRRAPKLAIGAVIAVKLHARKQTWPAVGGLSPGLPRRYVAAFAPDGE